MARLIDADVLIEHLDHCIAESKGLMRSVCVAIKCFVQQMPTVDAVPAVHGRWIPVEERLPDNDIPSARYLCYAKGYVRILKYWRMYKSFEYGSKPVKVTHWMPLPEPPKEE